ncbi:phage/plasmid primase, P4 family [Streptomyces sp. NBC_01180]|uniref:phage/plasmid primase, P4 family n=1 Tax=Streptomyces sp. NBC_01180 TaxID=2903763 RepID=UPI00386A7916|nr:phage/plasmid primase, P4 family [Streptomyces sp. NBC_01180]
MQLTDLLGRFDQVSEEPDGGYLAVCSAHTDSRPSLRIWVGENRTVRMTCRAGCETKAVVAAAGLAWADMFNIEGEAITVPTAKPAIVGAGHIAALTMYVDQAAEALQESGADALAYAARRFGTSADMARDLALGFDSGAASGLRLAFRSRAYTSFPRLVVPLNDFAGNPRGLQGRDISGQCPGRWVSLSNPDGHRWAPYGVFRGQGGYGVTIVSEGPGDGLTASAVGYDAVAVRGASLAASPDLLAELAEGLRGQLVVVAGDSDPAGQKFNRRVAEGLSAHGITVHSLALPDGVSDITEWREADSRGFAAAFHSAIKAAQGVATGREADRASVDSELSGSTGTDVVTSDDGHEAARVLAGVIARYGDTDITNAHALVAWSGGRIKWAEGIGFHVWDGRVWVPSGKRVRQEIHRMAAALMLAGKVTEARPFGTRSRIDDLLVELTAVPSVLADVDDFDNRPHLLNFRNGTVDLRSGKLREHRQGDMLTHCLDFDFNPSAKCPRWDRFLTEVFPDNPGLVSFMQRLTGYGITGSTDEQCFAVLWGKGSNGKSIYTDTLTTLFRGITRSTSFSTFEEKRSGGIPNDIAALRGARLVMASEGEAGKPMSEAVLKKASGKDVMSARFLHKELFEFKPTFLIMLASNHKPKFRGQDEGIWRRVKLIPFTRWFAPSEREKDLDMVLLREAEGIIAWAVRGAAEWYANGLQDPDTVVDAGKEYRETSDALAGFFPGVLERAEGATMLGSDAYNDYRDWCEAEGLQQKEVWSRRTFYEAMEERQVERKKTRTGISLYGVHKPALVAAPAGTGIFAKD